MKSSEDHKEQVDFKNEIISLTSSFIKEKRGKGPLNVRVHITGETIEVTAMGILLKSEKILIRDYPQHGSMKVIESLGKVSVKAFIDEFKHSLSSIASRDIEFMGCEWEFEKDKVIGTFRMI